MAFICIRKDDQGYFYIPEKRVLQVQYEYKRGCTTVAYIDENEEGEEDVFFALVSGEPTFIGVGE
jgi:hypothetical protein